MFNGIEINKNEVHYRCENYIYDAENIFATLKEAEERAKELAETSNQTEQYKINHKHKDTRSWVWNATYHRSCLRRLEKDMEYHKKSLNVANLKAKNNIQ